MSPLLLVDAGNTRTKVGVAGDSVRLILREAAFNPDEWAARLAEVVGPPPWRWAVAGVSPKRVAEVADWARSRGEECRLVRDYRDVPIDIKDCDPTQVGADRLFDSLAAARRKRPGVPAITLDAGTAIVVNLVSRGGAFLGGGIAPGLTTLFDSLHAATAKLPRVEVGDFGAPAWPGTTTAEAITAGCFATAVGGVTHMVAHSARYLTANPGDAVDLFLTGGDAVRIARHAAWPWGCRAAVVETLTLEGLMLAAANT